MVILFFLQEETDLGLSDSQEGYRRDRGGRCALLRLRMRIDVVLGLKIKGQAIMFEDMSSAFDKLTYSGIQDGLQVAGATRNTRAMVRACQKGASTVVRQQNPDGRKEHSGRLLFDAGILQGGMHSPHTFITVLGVGLALADPIES